MESKANQEKEAEAFGYPSTDTTYIIPPPSGKSALGMEPPLYYDTPGQKWSWCHVVTSVISFFFCACCGAIATTMAMASYTDHKARDFARSQKKRKWAYGCAITAIVLGSILIIGFVIMAVNCFGKSSHFRDGPYRQDRSRQPYMPDHQPYIGDRPDNGHHADMDHQPNMGKRHNMAKHPGYPNMDNQTNMDHHPDMDHQPLDQRPNKEPRPEMGKPSDMGPRPGMGKPSGMGHDPGMGPRPDMSKPSGMGKRPEMGPRPDMGKPRPNMPPRPKGRKPHGNH